MAQIGSLVVCIDDRETSWDDMFIFPHGRVVRDEIYTISGEKTDHDAGDNAWIIEEKPALWIKDGSEMGWIKSRFREIQPPMDISILIQEEITELV